jgi:hypothetical protein
MCWLCDHPDKTPADYLDHLDEKVRRNGWAVQYVEDERRPFAYTIGLTRHGLPELMMTGVCPDCAWRSLNGAARKVLDGDSLVPGMQTTLPDGQLVEVVYVTHPDAHLGWAVIMFGERVMALQLVWADGHGRWPWSADFDDGRGTQPVLGVRAVRRIA